MISQIDIDVVSLGADPALVAHEQLVHWYHRHPPDLAIAVDSRKYPKQSAMCCAWRLALRQYYGSAAQSKPVFQTRGVASAVCKCHQWATAPAATNQNRRQRAQTGMTGRRHVGWQRVSDPRLSAISQCERTPNDNYINNTRPSTVDTNSR